MEIRRLTDAERRGFFTKANGKAIEIPRWIAIQRTSDGKRKHYGNTMAEAMEKMRRSMVS